MLSHIVNFSRCLCGPYYGGFGLVSTGPKQAYGPNKLFRKKKNIIGFLCWKCSIYGEGATIDALMGKLCSIKQNTSLSLKRFFFRPPKRREIREFYSLSILSKTFNQFSLISFSFPTLSLITLTKMV